MSGIKYHIIPNNSKDESRWPTFESSSVHNVFSNTFRNISVSWGEHFILGEWFQGFITTIYFLNVLINCILIKICMHCLIGIRFCFKLELVIISFCHNGSMCVHFQLKQCVLHRHVKISRYNDDLFCCYHVIHSRDTRADNPTRF